MVFMDTLGMPQVINPRYDHSNGYNYYYTPFYNIYKHVFSEIHHLKLKFKIKLNMKILGSGVDIALYLVSTHVAQFYRHWMPSRIKHDLITKLEAIEEEDGLIHYIQNT